MERCGITEDLPRLLILFDLSAVIVYFKGSLFGKRYPWYTYANHFGIFPALFMGFR